MIYIRGDVTVIILESANLEELKKGRPAISPDKKVIIAWTPDLPHVGIELAKLFAACGGGVDGALVDSAAIGRIIDASRSRPENPSAPQG